MIGRFLLLIALALSAGCRGTPDIGAPTGCPDHVIVISIDGLRPEFYLDGEYATPNLKKLAADGAYARAVEGVFPSVTYPSHASIVTGLYPDKHGIVSNTKFVAGRGNRPWYWDASDIKARTLWQSARDKGLRVAITYWPSTVGADVDVLIPERWGESEGETTLDLLRKLSSPGLIDDLCRDSGEMTGKALIESHDPDLFIARAAQFVIRAYKPNLHLIHLIGADKAQHAYGPDSPKVKEAVSAIDGHVGEILRAAAGYRRLAVIIVGDHGFLPVSKIVSPNVLLAKEGLIDVADGDVRDWRVYAHASGGHCALFLNGNDGDAAKRAIDILSAAGVSNGERLYTIIDRGRLDKLRTIPGAFAALEAERGYMMQGSFVGKFVRSASTKGNHGYLPDRPEMLTGFIAGGEGINRGVVIERMKLVDIAPTIASLLSLDMPGTDGGEVKGLLTGRRSAER